MHKFDYTEASITFTVDIPLILAPLFFNDYPDAREILLEVVSGDVTRVKISALELTTILEKYPFAERYHCVINAIASTCADFGDFSATIQFVDTGETLSGFLASAGVSHDK